MSGYASAGVATKYRYVRREGAADKRENAGNVSDISPKATREENVAKLMGPKTGISLFGNAQSINDLGFQGTFVYSFQRSQEIRNTRPHPEITWGHGDFRKRQLEVSPPRIDGEEIQSGKPLDAYRPTVTG